MGWKQNDDGTYTRVKEPKDGLIAQNYNFGLEPRSGMDVQHRLEQVESLERHLQRQHRNVLARLLGAQCPEIADAAPPQMADGVRSLNELLHQQARAMVGAPRNLVREHIENAAAQACRRTFLSVMEAQAEAAKADILQSHDTHMAEFIAFERERLAGRLAIENGVESASVARELAMERDDEERETLDQRIAMARKSAAVEATGERFNAYWKQKRERRHLREYGPARGDCFPTSAVPR